MQSVINNIKGTTVNTLVSGYPVHFTRRRYGKTMFTWVSFYNGSEWIELGDPWPSLQVSATEIAEAIKAKGAMS